MAGAVAFWLANFLVSLTPVAAAYRSAMAIPYVPMLVEAAVGGLVIGVVVALPLVRYADRVPGAGTLGKALLLGLGALVLLTMLLVAPTTMHTSASQPEYWLLVATVINTIRIFALSLTIGLVTRTRGARTDVHPTATRRERTR